MGDKLDLVRQRLAGRQFCWASRRRTLSRSLKQGSAKLGGGVPKAWAPRSLFPDDLGKGGQPQERYGQAWASGGPPKSSKPAAV